MFGRPEVLWMERVDLAILFALKEEFDAFFPGIPKERRVHKDTKSGRSFFLFDWAEGSSPPYRCLTTFVGAMGAQDASLVTARILLSYSPANLVLVGIAGGLAKDALIGDVVIADEVRDYLQDGRISDAGFSPSGRVYKASSQISNILNFLDRVETDLWEKIHAQSRSNVRKILKNTKVDTADTIRADGLKIHVGHIASGPVVAASRKYTKWLRTLDRKFLAVEMESAGFMNAAYQYGEDSHVVVIRGISDKANAKKTTMDALGSGALRRLAMSNALHALRALVATNSFSRASKLVPDESGCRILGGPDSISHLSHPASYGDIQHEFRDKVYQSTPPVLRRVRVFGLTYAVFWTLMREMLGDLGLTDWMFDLHCIAPEFVKANAAILAEPWLADSVNRTSEMRAWFSDSENIDSLTKRNIKVRMRSFELLPFLHGKLFGDGTIFFHAAQWDKSGRLSYPNTFHEIVPDCAVSDRATAYRGLFGNWVDKYDRSIRETIFASPDVDWPAVTSEMRLRLERLRDHSDVQ
jgi:nucleoside phosphorylase